MCGIAGIFRFDGQPVLRDRLEPILQAIRRRGPDAQGIYLAGPIGLAHARLSIVDLATGAQPMHLPPRDRFGPLSIVFNGEIYNHRPLRQELQSLGHSFTTDHSDTEVLLHGYRAWGTDLAKHIHGMFAFAIFDAGAPRLFLCRDRAGKKPLYYGVKGRECVFASTIAGLIADPRRHVTKVDPVALLHYLRLGYTANQSLLLGVEELAPACWMTIDADGKKNVERYWRVPSLRSAADSPSPTELQSILSKAVSDRLDADVPVGCFLSGGIDSSLVAALAQKSLAGQKASSLQTFSMRMPSLAYDESEFAMIVADHIGSRHTTIAADPHADIMADLEELIGSTGEPTADSSILPTWWVSREAAKHIKVVLSGDGGDELFMGYERYAALGLMNRYGSILRALPRSAIGSSNPKSRFARARRLLDASVSSDPATQYQSMIHVFSEPQLDRLGLVTDATRPHLPVSGWTNEPDPARSAMLWDFENYLPMDVLRKVDRASMHAPVEVRCPLLDTRVIEFALSQSPDQLYKGGRLKSQLRGLASQMLPASIINRRKMGFGLPIGEWFRTTLREPMKERLLDPGLGRLGLRSEGIEELIEQHLCGASDHTHRLFSLLTLSIWNQNPNPGDAA